MKKFKEEKKLKVIEVPASGKSGWFRGAYCHYFVYSKFKGNFLLKGFAKEVEQWLTDNKVNVYFSNQLYFGPDESGTKSSRNSWHFSSEGVYINAPHKGVKRGNKWRSRFEVIKYRTANDPTIILSFKRMPKRWIPNFDKLT